MHSGVTQRIDHVERHDIRRVVGHEQVDILGADCSRPILDELSDYSLFSCFAIFGFHISSSLGFSSRGKIACQQSEAAFPAFLMRNAFVELNHELVFELEFRAVTGSSKDYGEK